MARTVLVLVLVMVLGSVSRRCRTIWHDMTHTHVFVILHACVMQGIARTRRMRLLCINGSFGCICMHVCASERYSVHMMSAGHCSHMYVGQCMLVTMMQDISRRHATHCMNQLSVQTP